MGLLGSGGVGGCWGAVGGQVTHLEVGGVLLQVGLDAAAQLQDPAPLGLQGSSEGLQGGGGVERGALRGGG